MYTRVKSNVSYGLWVIIICKYRLIDYNECITLIKDVDNGGDYAYVRTVGIWEISVPYPQFCCEPKIALKTVY